MTTIHFTARLKTDAVISERSATTGGHRTLDYIPGATLLGAAAIRYDSFGSNAFTVFHSGKVRFSNAYPLSPDGEATLPVPLAWHTEKGEELNHSVVRVKNMVHASEAKFAQWDAAGEQQKQLRSGYFAGSGSKIDPKKSYRLKTAIDRNKQGAADEAQLYGYQSLAAGSLWRFSVAFDSDLPPDLVQNVAAALSGSLRIGRSRSAEYGLLEAAQVTYAETFTPVPGKDLILYCVSDVALADVATGSPALIPDGNHLGISAVDFATARSYLRVRSYAPFNRTRKRFDLERQVIAKGSVLVFTRTASFTAEELHALQQRLASGVGLYRQDGLGQILVNPSFLAGFEFTPSITTLFPLPRTAEPVPLPELVQWLTDKAADRQKERTAIEMVDRWITALVAGHCPKNSQWGQLRNIALQEETVGDIRAKVTKLCSTGVSQKQWDKSVKVDDRKTTFAKFLLETVLAANVELPDAKNLLYLLGNRLPRKNNQQNGGDQ